MKILALCLIVTFIPMVSAAKADGDTTLKITGYLETYFLYSFNRPKNNTQPAFFYSYNRANEVNLNLGFVKLNYDNNIVRANFALMTGTYSNANLATEPGVLKNIFEANAGAKLSKTKNLWVDAGIFTSHIGFESAIGKDCWNLTRSILADNTPYYESGAKVSYTTDNSLWFFSAMVLNGWGRIQRIDGSSLPSFGTQVTFKPTNAITLNSSTFAGSNKPDSARLMRYFHNFYGIFQLSDNIGLTLGADVGIQQKSPHSSNYSTWHSEVIILRASISKKTTLALRGEYYSDVDKVIVYTQTNNGLRTSGVSFNADYKISATAVWRIEVRSLSSKDAIFTRDEKSVKTDTFISTSIAISF